MRVRLVTSVSLRKWKAALASPQYAEMWHKLIALALPRDRDRCPKCGSKDFLRSRRKNFIEFSVSKFVLPYRCPHCYLRFFRPVDVAQAVNFKRYRTHFTGLRKYAERPESSIVH